MTDGHCAHPLILLHGYLSDRSQWDLVLPYLSHPCVLAPNLPGFGNTPVLKAEPSLDALADSLAMQLKEQRIERAVVAGMSMGGYVALAFAERHPEMLAGLGLISTQMEADSPGMRRLRRTIIQWVQQKGPGAAMEALLERLFSENFQNNDHVTQIALQSASTASSEGICWALEAMAKRPSRLEVVKNLNLPILMLHGKNDIVMPIDRVRDMARINPKIRFVEVESGHATSWEAPQQVANALSQLVSRC